MIIDKINKFLSDKETTIDEAIRYEIEKLAGWAFKKQFMSEREDKPYTLRLSSAGKCAKQLGYAYHGYEKKGKEIDSRAKIIFFMGDLVEAMLMSLAKLAGCKVMATGFNQLVVDFKLGDTTIKGHPDGILVDAGFYLIECKSMSSYSFTRFQANDIDESYRVQINVYLESLGLEKCVLVGMNKDSGVLDEKIILKDDKIIKWARMNLTKVLTSAKDNLPEPLFAVNDKGFYPWQCLYCQYWQWCLPNAEKVLVGRSYKLREKKKEDK